MTDDSAPVDPAAPKLLGVDVGFSKTGKSTGLAWRAGGIISACRTGSSWASRVAKLPVGTRFDLAALDAPLVPPGPGVPRRGCEAVFYRGAFTKRCRPGMSHFGQGLDFRRAGALAADQFTAVVGGEHRLDQAAVPGTAMVEAFPNTFMGVLLPEAVFAGMPTKRGGKSDRLYEACLAEGVFHRLVAELGWPVAETISTFAAERDHDIRAAYVCLLTAAVAHAGTATVVGDPVGGWFWLPPFHLWATWARTALSSAKSDASRRGYPGLLALTAQAEMPVSVRLSSA